MNIILLSGGSGKRLWPLSNEVRSKQFLKVLPGPDGIHESMVQRMYRMIKEISPDAKLIIATSESQVANIRSQIGEAEISIEPDRRDTFPAIALATSYLQEKCGVEADDTVVVCPIDPYTDKSYFEMISMLDQEAKKGCSLTLMGIEPTYPSAKYGYIIPESVYLVDKVKSFKEKPSEKEAEALIKQHALWNGGVFAFKLSYVLNIAERQYGSSAYDFLFNHYSSLPKISFDYAIVEKETDIKVVRYNGEWKDLGTWNTLTEAMEDAVSGNAKVEKCTNTHVINELKIPLIALGLENVAVAATPDGILVTDKHQSSYLKDYVDDQRPMVEKKAWGKFEVLDYQVSNDGSSRSLTKHLRIKAGEQISYQRHKHRSKTWVIVEGEGEVILDDEVRSVCRGDTVIVPVGVKHASRALTDLHMIEVQVGDKLMEEDDECFDWDWTAKDRYNRWLTLGLMTDELKKLSSDQIESAFCSDLHFGTGGIRAVMGAGTNKMNSYTVAKTTQGLSDYLNQRFTEPSVIIAYDTRHQSREFAIKAASVFEHNRIKVFLFPRPVPTPMLSFAVRRMDASAGVVITASHNSKEYNGYKVYDDRGCQITDEAPKEIHKYIRLVGWQSFDYKDCFAGYIHKELCDSYIDEVIRASYIDAAEKTISILYTPLHGTGYRLVAETFHRAGFKNVDTVPGQEQPDGDFPTCPNPNPEEPEVLAFAYDYARKIDADIIIATDPDCDRIGVSAKVRGDEYRVLNPNEVGVLILDFICDQGKRYPNPVFMKTIVTTSMAEKIAVECGCRVINTLTGFKYIGEQIDKLRSDETFIFAMEESCGYLSNETVRDKDGVNAALLIAMVAEYYKRKNMTLFDRMEELYEEYGYYLNTQHSFRFDGREGILHMNAIMKRFTWPMKNFDGLQLISGIDYSNGVYGLPASEVREYRFSDGSRFIVRPSGTEQKLKVYIETVGKSREDLNEKEGIIIKEIRKILKVL